jgi:hypothetical protein
MAGLLMSPVPPIFLVGSNDVDVTVFPSISEAEGFMEAVDVEHHEYEAYDGLARRLQLRVRGYDVKIAGVLDESNEGIFKDKVARFLAAIGHPIVPNELTLEEFVRSSYSTISVWEQGRGLRRSRE